MKPNWSFTVRNVVRYLGFSVTIDFNVLIGKLQRLKFIKKKRISVQNHHKFRRAVFRYYIIGLWFRISIFTSHQVQWLTSISQLVSGFNGLYIFSVERAIHEEFYIDLLMSCTVFTVYNLAHNQEYISAFTLVGKISSRFLQDFALPFLLKVPANFEFVVESFNILGETRPQMATSQSWSTLRFFFLES
ncbi:hypothetical protein F4703DRAFT_1798576 [Phycomyces blakesleeanus]